MSSPATAGVAALMLTKPNPTLSRMIAGIDHLGMDRP